MKRLQPLLPDTRSRKRCRSSSIHKPIVLSATRAAGSICHHLQSLHKPHSDSAIGLPPKTHGTIRTGMQMERRRGGIVNQGGFARAVSARDNASRSPAHLGETTMPLRVLCPALLVLPAVVCSLPAAAQEK